MGRNSLTYTDKELDTYTSFFFKSGKKRKIPKRIFKPYWSKKQWGFYVFGVDGKIAELKFDMTFTEAMDKAAEYGYGPEVVGSVVKLYPSEKIQKEISWKT